MFGKCPQRADDDRRRQMEYAWMAIGKALVQLPADKRAEAVRRGMIFAENRDAGLREMATSLRMPAPQPQRAVAEPKPAHRPTLH
jgi:hypothetical protein